MDAVILLDLNSIGMQAQLGGTRLHAGSVETTAIYGVLRMLRSFRNAIPGKMIALHDGRSWRYDGFAAYKGDRDAVPMLAEGRAAWKAQKGTTIKAMHALGISQMLAKNLEADDLAARLRAFHAGKGRQVTLISGDKDWLQLIGEKTAVYDQVKQAWFTLENFKEKTELPYPLAMAEFKALTGDTSDNIKGVGGIGAKTAHRILSEFGSVAGFTNACMADPKLRATCDGRMLKMLDDADKQAAFERNMELIWLDHPKAPKAVNPRHVPGKLDPDALRTLCEEHSFTTIVRDLDGWITAFSEEG